MHICFCASTYCTHSVERVRNFMHNWVWPHLKTRKGWSLWSLRESWRASAFMAISASVGGAIPEGWFRLPRQSRERSQRARSSAWVRPRSLHRQPRRGRACTKSTTNGAEVGVNELSTKRKRTDQVLWRPHTARSESKNSPVDSRQGRCLRGSDRRPFDATGKDA